MKKTLLFLTLSLLITTLNFAQQNSKDCVGCKEAKNGQYVTNTSRLNIYPNPATNYIGLKNEEDVEKIIIYNLVGRKMKEFTVTKGGKYNISTLPQGLYLVQLKGSNNKTITTHRLNKK